MTGISAVEPAKTEGMKLRRRDWIVLPTLCLLTICLIIGSTESIARLIFSYSDKGIKDCTMFNDLSTGPRGIPNCVCWDKGYETQPIEYRLNRSGYRADTDFGPKAPGTYRIVTVGSSYAMAYGVDNKMSYAALLPGELTSKTGRRVDLLNEGFAGGGGVNLRLDEALARNPDMILWILTPWDIGQEFAAVHHPPRANRHEPFLRRAWALVKLGFAMSSTNSIQKIFSGTRTAFMLRHYLFESQSQYIKSFLMADDKEAGFLKAEPSAEWKESLQQFSTAVPEYEAQAEAAKVPLVAVLVPDRAQAAMISRNEWPTGYDPYKLNDELRSIIISDGGTYIDIFPGFRAIPNPERYYLPVDGHLGAGGNAILSMLLAKELTSGAVPALKAATQPHLTIAQGR